MGILPHQSLHKTVVIMLISHKSLIAQWHSIMCAQGYGFDSSWKNSAFFQLSCVTDSLTLFSYFYQDKHSSDKSNNQSTLLAKGSTQQSDLMTNNSKPVASGFPIEIEWENWRTRWKALEERTRTNNKLNRNDTRSGIQTRAILVGHPYISPYVSSFLSTHSIFSPPVWVLAR